MKKNYYIVGGLIITLIMGFIVGRMMPNPENGDLKESNQKLVTQVENYENSNKELEKRISELEEAIYNIQEGKAYDVDIKNPKNEKQKISYKDDMKGFFHGVTKSVSTVIDNN